MCVNVCACARACVCVCARDAQKQRGNKKEGERTERKPKILLGSMSRDVILFSTQTDRLKQRQKHMEIEIGGARAIESLEIVTKRSAHKQTCWAP